MLRGLFGIFDYDMATWVFLIEYAYQGIL